jgi:flavin-dependent dehydrogenase
VLVAGGGPAGSATAAALARLGRSVVLVERSGYDRPRLGEHVTPAVRPLLAAVGDAARLAAPHLPSHGISRSWGDPGTRHRDYLFDPHGSGLLLDRRRLDQDLAELAARAGATLWLRRRVTSVQREQTGCWLVAAVGPDRRAHQVTARFLVDATGRHAALARRLGAGRLRVDRLLGLAARLDLGPDGNAFGHRLLLESVEHGWWYATAVPHGRAVGVFLTDGDLLGGRSGGARSVWRDELQRTRLLRSVLASPAVPARCMVRPADSAILDRLHGREWLAIGEAAAAYDPLSSRGVVHAIRSGLAAAQAIDRALSGHIGELADHAAAERASFRQYLDERREVYLQERRWGASLFWRRRHERSTTAEARGRLARPWDS